MRVLPAKGTAAMTSLRFRTRLARVFLAAALALGMLANPATGQTPPSQVPAVVLAKPECGAKPEHPGRLASETMQRQWRKAAAAYLECYKNYAAESRALAQRYTDAANAVIDEYNTAAKELQAAAEAAAQ